MAQSATGVLLLMSAFGLLQAEAAIARESEQLAIVYRHVEAGADAGLERAVRAAYASDFRITYLHHDDIYVPASLRGRLLGHLFTAAGIPLGADISIAFVLTAKGRVVSPRVMFSTDSFLNSRILAAARQWTGTPAKLNGLPIPVLLYTSFQVHGADRRPSSPRSESQIKGHESE